MSDRIQIELADGNLQALVTITPGRATTLQRFDEALHEAGVVYGIDEAVRERLARRLADDKFACADVVIAQGQAAVHGEARWFEPRFEKAAIRSSTEVEGSVSKVDYHARSKLKPAKAGQCIAMMHPSKKPVNGRSVDGREIFAHPAGGSPKIAKLGMGTASRPDGSVVATRGGIIVYREGVSLEVSSFYEYAGDIDMRCGHLESCGKLKISGGVKKGFIAAATKNIEVGSIDGGSVYSKANIIVTDGIRTAETSIVSAIGNISCHHAEQALAESATALQVGADIVNSHVHAHDVVVGAKIIGGVTKAETSITVTELGSASGTATVVILGEPLVRPLECAIKGFSVGAARKLAVERRGSSQDAIKHESTRLSAEEKKARTKARHAQLETLEKLRNRLIPNAYLDVIDVVHPGVTIKIGTARLVIETKYHRARFRLDVENNRIVHGALDIEANCDKIAVAGV